MPSLPPMTAKRAANIRKQIKMAHALGPTYSIPDGPTWDARCNTLPPRLSLRTIKQK